MSASTDSIGRPPELAWLPVDRLDVDPAYQRTLDTRPSQKLIEKITANFRWIAFGAILAIPVGHGDERRWLIIDGQHRVAAAKRVGIPHVPAVVVAEASQAQQAEAFVDANRDRIRVSAQAIYYARLLAGDPNAVTIAGICEKVGIVIERYNKAANQLVARHTAAVPALLKLLQKTGDAAFVERVVSVIVDAWGAQPGALRSPFFVAVALYFEKGGPEKALRATLPQKRWQDLEEAARMQGGQYGPALAMLDKLHEWTGRKSGAAPPAETPPIQPAPPKPLKAGPPPEARHKPKRPLPDRAEGTARRVTDSDVAGSELVWDQETKSHKRVAVDATPEDAAVLTLRRDGDVVFRNGKSFSVNGRSMTATELLQRAERVFGRAHV